MALRDRFFTATTARAMLSWRLLLGAGAGIVVGSVVTAASGLALGVLSAVVAAVVVYAVAVHRAMPRQARPARIDPFTLGEPWRQLVQGAQRAATRLHATVSAAPEGPLRDRLVSIAGKLDDGLAESWAIARRGDELDDALRRLDRPGLRSKLAMLEDRHAASPTAELDAAIQSVRLQLDSADRLAALSSKTADRLRLTQTRLDELVARAAEVSVGASDTDTYATAVDDLVVELEALRLAVDETRQA
jgi:hypothetical protein